MSIGVGVERLLAEGPVAQVYVGRLDGAEVVVKVFDGSLDRDTAAWLGRERKALDTVRTERAILPVDEVIEFQDGRTGVRMELCQGSLAGHLGAQLPVRDVLAVGRTVAAALAAAHQVGVVHGGVTPHNVLFRRSGELVFADFGLALRRRFPHDPLHAVDYAAPETLRDDALSEASDLYGLGAVLYTALTGSSPFPRHTGQQRAERILQVFRDPVPPIQVPGVPPALSDLIGRLLAKDPADRPQDSASVAESLEKMHRASVGQVEVEFDDFAGTPPQPAPAQQPAPAPESAPGRTLVRSFDEAAPPRRDSKLPHIGWRPAVLAGLAVAVAGMIAVPMLTTQKSPSPQTGAPAAAAPSSAGTTTSPAPNVNLALATPTDQGTKIQLTWSADGDLDFAVIVGGERMTPMVLVANRDHTMSVPVDPARKYCFQIRGTDGTHIYQTAPVPIRGAVCTSS
ncbi:serine/threonine protein kinase [Kutzneria sp. CA-103260]|uniref:serine/threonine protein kinase n=1 Tax=Kutzneria sp. CA-103260 TaxID=2802641 RepID=UPI001BAC7EB5|nr:serine/threonine-protein kinase [Kutzneria sp. CA-103260]